MGETTQPQEPPKELSQGMHGCWSRRGRGEGGNAPPTYILVDQLTISQPEWAGYAHQINTCPPPSGFSDLPTALVCVQCIIK